MTLTKMLMVVTAGTLMITALAILLSWYVNRRIRGAHHWSLGYVLLAIGVGLQLLQHQLNPLISIALANTLLTAGIYFAYVGLRQFKGINLDYGLTLSALLAAVVAMHAWVGLADEYFAIRTFFMSSLIGCVALMTAIGFLNSEEPSGKGVSRISAVIFLLLAMAFIVRGMAVFFVDTQANSVEDTLFNQVTYFMAILFNILIAFAYILNMNAYRPRDLQRLVDTDVATGLLNKDGLARHIELRSKRIHEDDGELVALFMFLSADMQSFRRTEQGGTATAMLGLFAEKMLRCFKPHDILGRSGDWEFMVVAGSDERERLENTARYLQRTVEYLGTVYHINNVPVNMSYCVVASQSCYMVYDEFNLKKNKVLPVVLSG